MQRNKKYNPLKQVNALAKIALKHSAIGFVTGSVGCQLIDLRTRKVNSASEGTVRLISTLRHPWSVFIAVMGVDELGKHYMKAEEISVNIPVYQSEMIETLNRHHAKLGENFNHKHLLSYCWLATPYAKEWDEADAFKLLSKLGAFDFKRTEENEVRAV